MDENNNNARAPEPLTKAVIAASLSEYYNDRGYRVLLTDAPRRAEVEQRYLQFVNECVARCRALGRRDDLRNLVFYATAWFASRNPADICVVARGEHAPAQFREHNVHVTLRITVPPGVAAPGLMAQFNEYCHAARAAGLRAELEIKSTPVPEDMPPEDGNPG